MSKQVAICIDTPALGDTLAAIPTLRKLSKAYESQLVVFSSKPFLFENHPLVYFSMFWCPLVAIVVKIVVFFQKN